MTTQRKSAVQTFQAPKLVVASDGTGIYIEFMQAGYMYEVSAPVKLQQPLAKFRKTTGGLKVDEDWSYRDATLAEVTRYEKAMAAVQTWFKSRVNKELRARLIDNHRDITETEKHLEQELADLRESQAEDRKELAALKRESARISDILAELSKTVG